MSNIASQTVGEHMLWIPVYEIAGGDPILHRGLDRKKADSLQVRIPSPRPVAEATTVDEGKIIIASLHTLSADISPVEQDILLNPSRYSTAEYKGLADHHWWRISELGGAALEHQLKNFNLIYPNIVK